MDLESQVCVAQRGRPSSHPVLAVPVVKDGRRILHSQLRACSPTQRHLPVSGLTIWRKFKIERGNLGHLQCDNPETGKHKPLVFELIMVYRR